MAVHRNLSVFFYRPDEPSSLQICKVGNLHEAHELIAALTALEHWDAGFCFGAARYNAQPTPEVTMHDASR